MNVISKFKEFWIKNNPNRSPDIVSYNDVMDEVKECFYGLTDLGYTYRVDSSPPLQDKISIDQFIIKINISPESKPDVSLLPFGDPPCSIEDFNKELNNTISNLRSNGLFISSLFYLKDRDDSSDWPKYNYVNILSKNSPSNFKPVKVSNCNFVFEFFIKYI